LRERGSDRRTGIQWQEADSRGKMPAREVIAASILTSKSRKLRNARKEPDASRDAVAEKRERGPTGEAEDGGYSARGLGGDSGGLSLTIHTSAGGAAKNDASVPLDGKGGESVRRKDCVGGGGRETGIFPKRERYPGGSEDADSVLGNEVRDASVDEKAGVINVG
jgi:hypothetical protein